MNTIIIEDEKLSADHLANLIGKVDKNIKVLNVFDSVKQSVRYFQNNPNADLLFVDIHLADGVSFEIFSKVVIESPVIFTTAYDEYAIKAFKVNSVDYLLKPIGIDELKVALEKFKKLKNSQLLKPSDNIIDAYQIINKQYKNRFMVKIGANIISVKTEEITHFIAEDGIVLIVTKNGKRYPIDYTLDQSELLLNPDIFFRINRKTIININSIQKVNTYFNNRLKIDSVVLQSDDAIVSRERVAEFKKWLDK